MQSVADKLADLDQRIADAERRVAEQQARITHGRCDDTAEAAMLLYLAASTLRELRTYKARLEHLIEIKAARQATFARIGAE